MISKPVLAGDVPIISFSFVLDAEWTFQHPDPSFRHLARSLHANIGRLLQRVTIPYTVGEARPARLVFCTCHRVGPIHPLHRAREEHWTDHFPSLVHGSGLLLGPSPL